MWKVAIIDDDPYVLRGMKKIIPWAELDLEFVGEEQDGHKGLELIRTACPDIVITDIYMPVLNGLDMIEKLRDEGFQGKIVILSGYSDFEYARQAVRLDVDDYLSKPTSIEMLRKVMEKLIHRLEEELIKKEKMDEVYHKDANPELSETQLEFYHNFAQAIRNSKACYAKELVKGHIVHLQDINFTSQALLQQYTKEIWTILAYTLFDAGIVLNDIYPNHTLQNDLDNIISLIQFELWLLHIIDVILESRKYKDNLKHQKAMDTIIEYIHEHYTEDISLEELSDIVSISKNYLCYIFKKATGETFNQYLTRVRIEKAKEMILDGKWLVYEIAEKVGYKNIPYFSTVFKKITGHTPTDLVKN
ncbi:response regulator [Paenibacillus filicis]|uniref:Response regulator n=1 Tax=Paenibacillus gyeongsangnamensis TaxID=3388067 RepID=A0ABT4QDR9_9BACL|nr:response regulator [Paenibacillus filicis]MCZ8515013.1 response regulator [Paenibacillus filicis]